MLRMFPAEATITLPNGTTRVLAPVTAWWCPKTDVLAVHHLGDPTADPDHDDHPDGPVIGITGTGTPVRLAAGGQAVTADISMLRWHVALGDRTVTVTRGEGCGCDHPLVGWRPDTPTRGVI